MGSSACLLLLIICQAMESASDWSPTLNGLSRRSSLAHLMQKCQSKNSCRCANYFLTWSCPSAPSLTCCLSQASSCLCFGYHHHHAHTGHRLLPNPMRDSAFLRPRTPMPDPRPCFPRQAWDIWSVLECSWGGVFPGMWFLALGTDRPISHVMLPEEEGCESRLDEGRRRGKCRHRTCGCGREKRWAYKSESFGDPHLQNILVPWALREFTTRASPMVFQMHFTIELMVDLFQWLSLKYILSRV